MTGARSTIAVSAFLRPWAVLLCVLGFAISPALAAEAAQDQLKPCQFPSHDAVEEVDGRLVAADFIHRSGAFRQRADGKLIEFLLPPYGSVMYLSTEADLRDVPLGTVCRFFLLRGSQQRFAHLVRIEDQSSGENDGKDDSATEQQRRKSSAFQKVRGLPGWIDADEGDKLTVTLFSGDAKAFQQTWLNDFKIGGEIKVVVANDELRTWNPPVDNERGTLLEIQKTATDAYGTSGVRLVFTVAHMLEGFRKGRIVRIFGPGWPLTDPPFGEGLMNYGYGPLRDSELAENLPKEYPSQFPFRTDFGNADLPWYKVTTGVVPPRFSEHLVLGELTKVDSDNRSGEFRTDQTGEIVAFSVVPQGAARHKNTNKPDDNGPARFDDVSASVRYMNADAKLADIPLETRCRFHLYQDDKGAFTRASLVSDEFSYLSENFVSYRIEAIKLDEGKLYVARQLPQVKNYNGDMVQPPDVGRTELLIVPTTRVWRNKEPVKTSDLKIGDSLLVNVTSELSDSPSHCTDIWIQ
jgi:hypothetical protein